MSVITRDRGQCRDATEAFPARSSLRNISSLWNNLFLLSVFLECIYFYPLDTMKQLKTVSPIELAARKLTAKSLGARILWLKPTGR